MNERRSPYKRAIIYYKARFNQPSVNTAKIDVIQVEFVGAENVK